MLVRIDMPHKVELYFGNQAVAWEGMLCLLSEKGCGTAGDIIDNGNSLNLVGGDTGHLVLTKLALLLSKYMCQPRSCCQAKSWAYSKNWVDQVVGDSCRGMLVLSRPQSKLCVEFHWRYIPRKLLAHCCLQRRDT